MRSPIFRTISRVKLESLFTKILPLWNTYFTQPSKTEYPIWYHITCTDTADLLLLIFYAMKGMGLMLWRFLACTMRGVGGLALEFYSFTPKMVHNCSRPQTG